MKEWFLRTVFPTILMGVVAFNCGFIVGHESNVVPTFEAMRLIHQSTKWELKSLHYLHELNKCEGKEK